MHTRRGWISWMATVAAATLIGCTRNDEAHADRAPAAPAASSEATAATRAVAWTPSEFLRALPRRTVAYVCVRNLDRAWDTAGETRLAPILADARLGPLAARIAGAIEEEFGLKDAGGGALRSLAAARIELAVVGVESMDLSWSGAPNLDPFDVALAVTQAKEPAVWANLFASLQDRWVRAGAVVVSGFRAGAWKLLEIGKPGSSIAIGSAPDGWLLGTKRDTIETLVERWGGSAEDGLAGVPAFADARGHAGSDPLLFVYADLQRVVPFAEIPESIDRVLDATGIGALQAVAFSAEVAGGVWRERIRFQAPQESRGLLGALLPQGTGVSQGLRLIPERALSASVQRIDASSLWASVQRIISGLDPRAAQTFHQGLASFETRFGVSVERDIFGALGDLLASYVTTGPEGGQEMVWIVALRDAGSFQRAVQGIAKGVGIPAQPIEVAGSPALALAAPIPFPGIPGGAPGAAMHPCLVFAPSHAVFATSPGAAQGCLDHLARGRASIADRPEWRKVAAGLPADGCAISYTDLGAGVRSLSLALAQVSSAPGAPKFPIDMKALSLDGAKDAGPAIAIITSDPRGFALEIGSEIGLAPMGVAIIAAAAGPSLAREFDGFRTRQEEEADRVLRGLVPAQESFRTRHGRYARVLSELAREGLVSIDLSEGIHRGYLIKIQAQGAGGGWEAKARPLDGRGRSILCDAGGTVRPVDEPPRGVR